MKKIYFLTIFVLAAVSCNKDKLQVPEEKTNITFTINMGQTRASAESIVTADKNNQTLDEQKINTLQVFVFRDGQIDGYGSSEESSLASVSCTVGTRTVYALVNHEDISTIKSEEELKEVVSELTSESGDCLTMIGSDEIDVESDGFYSIDIKRLAAKIVIKKIENNLAGAIAEQPFELSSVYITNVPSKMDLGMTEVSQENDSWFNKGGYQSSNNLGDLTNDLDLKISIASGKNQAKEFYYYSYPNDNDQSDYSETWAPKRTMLVVKVKIDDKLYNYPIALPALESNKMYVIDKLSITRLGNPDDGKEGGADEENPITSTEATFAVSTLDWVIVPIDNISI